MKNIKDLLSRYGYELSEPTLSHITIEAKRLYNVRTGNFIMMNGRIIDATKTGQLYVVVRISIDDPIEDTPEQYAGVIVSLEYKGETITDYHISLLVDDLENLLNTILPNVDAAIGARNMDSMFG